MRRVLGSSPGFCKGVIPRHTNMAVGKELAACLVMFLQVGIKLERSVLGVSFSMKVPQLHPGC